MNGHANIDTVEATEHLKIILNVGKSETDSGNASKLKGIANGNMDVSGDGNMLHTQPYQQIDLCANKESSHVTVCGTNVDIYSSPLEYGATSSQVIVEDMVDYGWEDKYYSGRLISIHLSGHYLAYVLKPASNKPGYVRLLRTHLDIRHLIKDYKSEVKDISFAHTASQVLLGSVDACGELLVHKIEDDGTVILCDLLLRITRPEDWAASEHNRIIWCLYIPDDNDNAEEDTGNEDVTSLLVVTHNERAEIWNVQTIVKSHGHGKLTIDDVKIGVQVISDHKMPISSATFSPDGTALAIGSLDGVVKFFQVNTLEKDISPRCLHQWTPHPGKSLLSLYFLDNHKNHRPDIQFWKYAVTGAENNTEIKVWSCESWTCLQTISIYPNPGDSVMPCLKAEIDLSSKYLFLSDIKRKVLLVLYMEQDPGPGNLLISSVSEYRVPLPVLSLAVANVSFSKLHASAGLKNSDDEGECDQIGDGLNDSDETLCKYIIRLFWIQTKTLQSCRILYKPKHRSPLQSVGSVSSLSQDSYIFKDGLSDISMDSRDTSARAIKDLSTSSDLPSLLYPTPPASLMTEVLLTPDDFTTSPSHHSAATQGAFAAQQEVASGGADSLPVTVEPLQRRKSSQHSAASSPSREVAEILAPATKELLHLDEMVNESVTPAKDEIESVSNNLGSFSASGASGTSRNSQEYHLKEWPQAPDPTKDYRLAARNENDIQSHPQHFHSDNVEVSVFPNDLNIQVPVFSQNFDSMNHKLDSIVQVLRDQHLEIQGLQNEIKVLRQDHKMNQLHQKDNSISNLEQLITQNLVPHHSRLEKLIVKMTEEERRRSDRELVLLSDEISATFSNKLESTLKQELASNVVPQINCVLDTIAQKMKLDFSQKLTNTDAGLRDSISKHLKGKAFIDSLSQSLSGPLQGNVQSVCKDVFQNSVVPSFDKACHNLFAQLNEHFTKGTLDYVQYLEKHANKSCSSIDNMLIQLREQINKLVSEAQQTIQAQVSNVQNLSADMMKQHEVLLADIRHTVQEELRKQTAAAVLHSRSTTPVPHLAADRQLQKQQIMQLVRQDNLAEAFQMALSAMDVQLVLFLCESVSVDQVFGPTPCPLKQHVLLSLVNQLSADLNVKTEIKVRYIEDVIPSLDSNNAITREHIRGVLENLQQRISNFLARNPTHRLARSIKRISLAVDSLIK